MTIATCVRFCTLIPLGSEMIDAQRCIDYGKKWGLHGPPLRCFFEPEVNYFSKSSCRQLFAEQVRNLISNEYGDFLEVDRSIFLPFWLDSYLKTAFSQPFLNKRLIGAKVNLLGNHFTIKKAITLLSLHMSLIQYLKRQKDSICR